MGMQKQSDILTQHKQQHEAGGAAAPAQGGATEGMGSYSLEEKEIVAFAKRYVQRQ